MKIQIASDLHLEARAGHMPSAAAFRTVRSRDLLILAGDIGRETQAKTFIRRELDASPVLYVPGNHEYYGFQYREDVDAQWQALAAERPHLHYLVAEGVTIDGVRFWGAPWYSDLWGLPAQWKDEDPWRLDMFERYIMDFRYPHNSVNTWTLAKHIESHLAQTERLAAQAGQVDVVITHWPPTKDAIHPKHEGDALNPYFINDRADLVREIGAKLWISGHTHEAYDYRINATRCIGNPSGYLGEDRQSKLFAPDKVVEI